MKNLPLIDITDCFSKKDIIIKLKLPLKGNSYKIISDYILKNNLDISHFDTKKNQRVYNLIEKECPICSKVFTTSERTQR
jgi:hypothetical protein